VGLVPKLILSKDNVDFGSQVVRTSSQPGKSPYSHDVYLRNNTDAQLQVSVGYLMWPKQETACLGVYAFEGLNADDGFVCLGPEEGLGFTVRFTPTAARSYNAVLPVYIDGNASAAYMQINLSGAGTLPQLTFDVAECLLPPVSCWRTCLFACTLATGLHTQRWHGL
jgi:hypothetical protein